METQTIDQSNPELFDSSVKPPEITQEKLDEALKFIYTEQKALYEMLRLDIRNYLNLLTAHGTTEVRRKQIKESFERAIIMAMDFGTDVLNPALQQKGDLAKIENAFAAHIVRCKENGMVIIANNMGKKEVSDEATTGEENGKEVQNEN
jgi:hypothetical protein